MFVFVFVLLLVFIVVFVFLFYNCEGDICWPAPNRVGAGVCILSCINVCVCIFVLVWYYIVLVFYNCEGSFSWLAPNRVGEVIKAALLAVSHLLRLLEHLSNEIKVHFHFRRVQEIDS